MVRKFKERLVRLYRLDPFLRLLKGMGDSVAGMRELASQMGEVKKHAYMCPSCNTKVILECYTPFGDERWFCPKCSKRGLVVENDEAS